MGETRTTAAASLADTLGAAVGPVALAVLPHGVHRQLHELRLHPGMLVLALGVLLLAAALLAISPTRPAAAVFGVATLLWWTFDGAYDGPTIVHITNRHGVTLADLLPVACLLPLLLVRRRALAPERR